MCLDVEEGAKAEGVWTTSWSQKAREADLLCLYFDFRLPTSRTRRKQLYYFNLQSP